MYEKILDTVHKSGLYDFSGMAYSQPQNNIFYNEVLISHVEIINPRNPPKKLAREKISEKKTSTRIQCPTRPPFTREGAYSSYVEYT